MRPKTSSEQTLWGRNSGQRERERERAQSKRHKEGEKNKVQFPQPERSFTEKENKDERVRTVFIYHSQPNQ